jgi:hypothetical protein
VSPWGGAWVAIATVVGVGVETTLGVIVGVGVALGSVGDGTIDASGTPDGKTVGLGVGSRGMMLPSRPHAASDSARSAVAARERTSTRAVAE